MRQSRIIVFSLVLIFTHSLFGSDSTEQNRTIKGPIARATGLSARIVAFIVGYRGPVHNPKKGNSRTEGNRDPLWWHKQSLQIYHPPRSYINNDYMADVHRVYMDRVKDIWLVKVNSFDPDNCKLVKTSDYYLKPADRTVREEVLRSLNAQATITEMVRRDHLEIPLAIDSAIVAQEIRDKVIVATAGNEIEIWPLEYGDFEPNTQNS